MKLKGFVIYVKKEPILSMKGKNYVLTPLPEVIQILVDPYLTKKIPLPKVRTRLHV